jgi:hypothetical protein
MVQCAVCKKWEYRDDASPRFFGRAHIERHFEEMKLDDRGVCEQCREAEATISAIGTQFPVH